MEPIRATLRILCLAACLWAPGPPAEAQTLRRDVVRLQATFASGAYGAAAQLHDEIVSEYGEEPEFRADGLDATLALNGGLAHLFSGDAAAGLPLLEQAATSPRLQADPGNAWTIDFFLAEAQMQSGRIDEGIDRHLARADLAGTPHAVRDLHCLALTFAPTPELIGPERRARLLDALNRHEAHGDGDRALCSSLVLLRMRFLLSLGLETEVIANAESYIAGCVVAHASALASNLLLQTGIRAHGDPQAPRFFRSISLTLDPRKEPATHRGSSGQSLRSLPLAYLRQRVEFLEAAAAQAIASDRNRWLACWIFHYGRSCRQQQRPVEAAVVLAEAERLEETGDGLTEAMVEERILAESESGNALEALRLCRQAIERGTGDAKWKRRMNIHLARALAASGEIATAIPLVSGVIEETTDDGERARWILERGKLRLEAGVFAEARDDFERIGDAAGSLGESARLMHAVSWIREQAWERALPELARLRAQFHPDQPVASVVVFHQTHALLQTGQTMEAVDAVASFLKDGPDPETLGPLLLLGSEARLRANDAGGALEWLDRIVPDSEMIAREVVCRRGRILLALGEREATQQLTESALYDPGATDLPADFIASMLELGVESRAGNDPGLREWRTRAFAAFGARHDVEGMLAIAEALNQPGSSAEEQTDSLPELARLRWQAGAARALRSAGSPDRADLILLSIYEESEPESLDADLLSEVGALLTRFEYPAAESYLNEALNQAPDSWAGKGGTHELLARIALERGENERARAEATEAVAWAGDSAAEARALMHRARAAAALGETEEAITDLEEILAQRGLGPSLHARALLLMAQVLRLAGDAAGAEASLHRVIRVFRGERALRAEALIDYAGILSERGEEEAARSALREVIEDPAPLEIDLRRRATDILLALGKGPLEPSL